MFIGHFAVGLASKRFAPQTSLGMLMAAALMLDLLWPFFVLLDWEEVHIEPGNTAFTPLNFISYPISHSLLGALIWASILAALYLAFSRYTKGAIVVWVGVVSHWVLDVITHRPDMPLYPGSARLGFGLWNSPASTVTVEALMYLTGIWIYLRVTRAKDGIGRWGFWTFVFGVAAFYLANIFSPPPPSIKTMLIAMIPVVWLLIVWAWWFDRHRQPRQVG